MTSTVGPPSAKRVPHTRTYHGDTVTDDYAWLAEKDDPATVAYLTAENSYTDARTEHLAALRGTIFDEIKARTQETDLSVPVRKGRFWYYSRTVEGQQYGIHCRRPAGAELDPPSTQDGAPLDGEVVLLDDNIEAGDSDFFALGTFDLSPDGHLLAYSVDLEGDERFTLKVKDLRTGELRPDTVARVGYGSAWSADASTLFYLTVDDAWRPHRVWRHRLGTPATEDVLVFEEPDERFWVGVGLTRSDAYLMIDLHSKVTSEVYLIPADQPQTPPRLVAPRRQGVEYELEHDPTGEGRFLVLHNENAENFTLAWAPIDAPDQWHELIPHAAGTRLLGVDAFAEHVVVSLRRDGLTGLRVLPLRGDPFDIAFPEPLYTVGLDSNPEYATTTIRLHYSSLVTPDSVYDYSLATGHLVLRKQRPVLGGYSADAYEQRRGWATAPDGTPIPLSVVVRRDTPRDGHTPTVLYGYGAYEISLDPWFSVARLSLLDRGFAFAVAHIRGGGELGRHWYNDGKLLAKKNTFTDFVACAGQLVSSGLTTADRIVARGGSAGGLLMGAIANIAPTAVRAIVAEVPFVDMLTTTLDPSLPLTVTEWEEWGNPLDDPEVYAYLRSYSPYENVAPVRYPAILALGSLNDTRVLYHEPAKWVARLRAISPESDVLLKTEMGAGHGGPSGRYDSWREEAYIVAWILDQVTH